MNRRGVSNLVVRTEPLFKEFLNKGFREIPITNMNQSPTQMDIGLRFRGKLPHDKCDESYRIIVRVHDMYELPNYERMRGMARFFFEAEVEVADTTKYGEHTPRLKMRVTEPENLLKVAEDFWKMMGSPVV